MLTQDPQEIAYEFEGQTVTEKQLAAILKDRQDAVRGDLVKMRDEWVAYRAQSGVELRWRKAADLYIGDETSATSTLVETLKSGQSSRKQDAAGAQRSRVVVNIVRPKVDQAVARMCEILLPVDDKNWGIRPTPVPSAVKAMIGDMRGTVDPQTKQPTGVTADDEAHGVIVAAREACEKMQTAIDDALNECGYNGEQRKGIEDAVRLGPCIIEGPFLANQFSKAWVQGADGMSTLGVNATVVPASARRDPWDIWFDPSCGNDHQRGAGYWSRRFVTRKELRLLVGLPGFDADAIAEVLKLKPTRVTCAEGRVLRSSCAEQSYELWQYHGEIEPESMAYASMNTGDPLTDVEFGLVLMVNDKVIGAMDSWIVDKTLPVDVWCWRKSDSDPYGYGLPWELEHQQRVVTSAWRQVMDNARVTAGGQILVKRKAVTPNDSNYTIYPNKIWDVAADVDDVNKVFGVVNMTSHLQELLAIAESAMKFADQETSMPQIMGGEKGSAPETVGGMVMLYNTANAVLRMRVKLYDDCITRPHIGRHYDWHMANNPDQSLKGDMEVDARGATSLLEKDIQNQTTMNMANVTANPRFAAFIDPKRELVMLLKAFKVQPDDIMFSAEDIKKNEQNAPEAPPDPRIAAAQIMAETKAAELADRKEDRAAKQANNVEQVGIKREQIAYNTERERTEAELAVAQMDLNREIAIADLSSNERVTAATLDATDRLERLKLDQKGILFNAEAALRVRTGQGI